MADWKTRVVGLVTHRVSLLCWSQHLTITWITPSNPWNYPWGVCPQFYISSLDFNIRQDSPCSDIRGTVATSTDNSFPSTWTFTCIRYIEDLLIVYTFTSSSLRVSSMSFVSIHMVVSLSLWTYLFFSRLSLFTPTKHSCPSCRSFDKLPL